jgi:hypothetical protein
VISGPSPATKAQLLSFNRAQYRVVTGLLSGYTILRRYLYVMGLSNNPTAKSVVRRSKTTFYVCDALASLRHVHLGSFFWTLRILRI